MTALVHVTRAMQHLGKLAADASPGAADQAMGLAMLNDLVQAMGPTGMRLNGNTAFATFALISTDNVYPIAFYEVVQTKLALRMATQQGVQPSPALQQMAAQALAAVLPIQDVA